MRKFLLLSAIAASFQLLNAQAGEAPSVSIAAKHIQRQLAIQELSTTARTQGTSPAQNNTATNNRRGNNNTGAHNEKSLANGTPLNSQKIGSAGNLLTVTEFNCNQLYVNDPLGLVSFVHRIDNNVTPTANIAQYAYDFSTNSGQSWTSNIGPITVGTFNGDPIDNLGSDPHGRFPQAAIYNPTGNTDPANAQFIYSGTWHNAPPTGTETGSWVGQMFGNGSFGGAANAFNVNIDTINGGTTAIATGFCQSTPGTFWTVNENYTGDFLTTTNEITRGIIVEKGVWNSNTSVVDWTATTLPVTFDSITESGILVSMGFSFDIAFDPTGQNGWISCVGDVQSTADSTLSPIFWSTTNGGATWNGPVQLPLDSLHGVVNNLSPTTHYNSTTGAGPGLLTSGIPTLETEARLAVDYLGNPHLLCTVGNGGSYGIEEGAGYIMYDITLNPQGCDSTWNGWAAVFIDSVETLTGNTTTDAPVLTEDNRPLVSRSSDGKTIFFFWSASDVNITLADNNASPNLFARGFDLVHATSTKTVNLTQGDSKWGGPTVAYPQGGSIEGGTLQGEFYSTASPIALTTSAGFTVPLVLTQIDYLNSSDVSTGPAQFWYIDNINFSPFDFTNGITASININGPDTIILPVGTHYTDQGATITYLDTACLHSGILHVVTDASGVNNLVPGVYYVNYSAQDVSGNVYGNANRVIIVVSAPKAYFTYSISPGLIVQFVDSSSYNPTYWEWSFGDNQVDDGTDATTVHAYASPGTYYVCLTDTNAYGTSAPYCDSVVVLSVGINQIDFASRINMFPNPTSGVVTITLTGNSTPDFNVSVYNVLGEEVLPVSEFKAGTTNVQLNANTLTNGVYLVKIQSAQGSSVKRLTVAHK